MEEEFVSKAHTQTDTQTHSNAFKKKKKMTPIAKKGKYVGKCERVNY